MHTLEAHNDLSTNDKGSFDHSLLKEKRRELTNYRGEWKVLIVTAVRKPLKGPQGLEGN